MTRLQLALACGALLAISTSCSKQQGANSGARDLSQFACNDRQVEYMVAGGFAADEAGIIMACDGENPRIVKWRLEEGGRVESSNPLSGEQFDDVWKRVDSTGWRHLAADCVNPQLQGDDPVYVIDVGDYEHKASMSCQARTLPFPYDRIVNELDLRAAGFGDQDGAAR